jgi:hypothetical protein
VGQPLRRGLVGVDRAGPVLCGGYAHRQDRPPKHLSWSLGQLPFSKLSFLYHIVFHRSRNYLGEGIKKEG